LIFQEGFALIFQTCIYHTLIWLTLSLSPCSPIIQQLSVHFVMLSSYRDACISILFTLYHSLFLFHILLVSSNRITITIMVSLSLFLFPYVCICIYIYVYKIIYAFMYTFIFRSSFHMWGKTCHFCPLSLAYFT
jgi:hypothetical protein